MPLANGLALWASSPTSVYAAAAGGLAQFDGTAWRTAATGSTAALRDVFGTSASDVWAVGDSGTVLHFDGQAWRAAVVDTTARLTGVWASRPTNVWVVGLGGQIRRRRGPQDCAAIEHQVDALGLGDLRIIGVAFFSRSWVMSSLGAPPAHSTLSAASP